MSQVTYDHRALKVDGRRVLILSGGIHYPRSTPGMWPELMKRSLEAGLNTIETYVFWNLHERRRGVFDFSDRLDLMRFCRVVGDHGMRMILRIGPYICAETNYGGLPPWLRDVPGMQMRTNNEPWKAEMARWVRLLCDYLRPMFAPQGGPILAAQIENEYSNIAATYGEEGKKYLDWAVALTQSLNLGIPWVMCCGSGPGVLETLNGYVAYEQIDQHFAQHPGQPALWTEHWPGWYNTWGYPQNARAPKHVAYGTARFFAAGGAGVNYYMWHGGTNFGRESMLLQTTGYDFGGPLDEYGLATTKSRHLARLHRLLAGNADVLLNCDRPAPVKLGEKQSSFTYCANGRNLTFLCNDDLKAAATLTHEGRPYELPALSVLILGDANVLMNTAEIEPSSVVRRSMRPVAKAIRGWGSWADATPGKWPAASASPVVAHEPVEGLTVTRDQTDYCWYSAKLKVSAAAAGEGELTLTRAGDVIHVFVDGKLAATSSSSVLLTEGRGDPNTDGYKMSFPLKLRAGEHRLDILCCALGLIKGDWMLGMRNMVEERKGLWGPVLWKGKTVKGPWTMQAGVLGERCGLFADSAGLVRWRPGKQAVGKPLTWFRATFNRPKGSSPLAVDLSGMNKGLAWLNGRCVGRYWLLRSVEKKSGGWGFPITFHERVGEPTQRYYHLPSDWLADENTLVLFEELGGDPSSVTLCQWR